MTRHYLELDVTFSVPANTTDERFEEFLDCVMDELASIGRPEADLVATLAEHRAVFTDLVADQGFDEAVRFLGDLRTALHSAKCDTPNWPSIKQFVGMTSRDGDLATA